MRQPRTRASRPRFLAVVAALSVITLGASSPIYSAVSGRVVGGHTSASPVTAVATADCSTAAATEIVLRLHLNDPEVAGPVGRLLCGSFTGPGSQTMVVSLWGPGNSGLIHWVVFRWVGDAWQFLMKQPAAASITAAGSDIRQTLPIYRASDARCCPTGGTKTRIWHWEGTRFVAGPWKQVTSAKSAAFHSPTAGIECGMVDVAGSSFVQCWTFRPPQKATLHATGRLTVCRGSEARCKLGNIGEQPPTLGYGRQISVGRFRCLSLRSGVKCTVIRSGRGFLINNKRVSRIGP
jgi:hypothetical protein